MATFQRTNQVQDMSAGQQVLTEDGSYAPLGPGHFIAQCNNSRSAGQNLWKPPKGL